MITPLASALQIGGLAGGGAITTGILSFLANSAKDRHQEHLAALQVASDNYKIYVDDTANARTFTFRFARRVIVLSLFILIPVLMYVIVSQGHSIAIPSTYHHSFLFGLFETQGTKFTIVNGFVLMMRPISDLMAVLGGFYFGAAFKR